MAFIYIAQDRKPCSLKTSFCNVSMWFTCLLMCGYVWGYVIKIAVLPVAVLKYLSDTQKHRCSFLVCSQNFLLIFLVSTSACDCLDDHHQNYLKTLFTPVFRILLKQNCLLQYFCKILYYCSICALILVGAIHCVRNLGQSPAWVHPAPQVWLGGQFRGLAFLS